MAQASSTTTHAALLKELYTLPPVRALNDKSWLHDNLTKEQAVTDISGKYALFPVTLRRSLGRGSRADGGVLPSAISEVLDDARVYVKYHYYGLEWTEVVEEASKNKQGAFEKVVTMKMKNVATDMAKDINRQWYNSTGILAQCNTNDAAGLVITVASTQYVQPGDVIDIAAATTGVNITNGNGRLVASKTDTTITIDTAAYNGGGSGTVDVAGTEIVLLTGTRSTRRPTRSGTATSARCPARWPASRPSSCSTTTSESVAAGTSTSTSPRAASAGAWPTSSPHSVDTSTRRPSPRQPATR
jgi:hypothetical protein